MLLIRLQNFFKKTWPFLFIVFIGLILYGPYLSGFRILLSSGALARYSVWDFFASHQSWFDFFRSSGLFLGGDFNFGWFNPLVQVFRFFVELFSISSSGSETFLTFIYFCLTWIISYLFLRKLGFKSYIAIFASSFYVLNGLVFKDDTNISLGFAMLLPLPLLMLIAWDGLLTFLSRVLFVSAVFFSLTYGHPQMVFWALALVGFYFLFFKSKKELLNFIILTCLGFIISLPQLLLTAAMFKQDWQSFLISSIYTFNSGLGLIDLVRGIVPFFSTSLSYITPFYYINPLAYLLFFYGFWQTLKNSRILPRWLVFFTITAIIAFVGSFNNSPVQWLLSHLPVLGTLISRNPFRYLAIFYFCLSVIVAYWLEQLLQTQDKVKLFFKKISWIGWAMFSGYLLSTLFIAVKGNYYLPKLQIWALSHYANSGHYPNGYYLGLFQNYLDQFLVRFTLLHWSGWILVLPWIILGLGFFLIKYKPRLMAIYFIISIISSTLVFGLVLAQKSSNNTILNFSSSNDFSFYLKEHYTDVNQSYVMAYGNYNDFVYYVDNNYLGSLSIKRWLKDSGLSGSEINYSAAPVLRNFTNPFQPFRPALITTYLGLAYGLDNSLSFNNQVFGRPADLTSSSTQNFLANHLSFLKQIGVRFIVSPESIEGSGLNQLGVFEYPQTSNLQPEFKAKYFAYELKDPGKIVFVPEKVKTAPFENKFNFKEVKNIFDQLNQKQISAIEIDSNNQSAVINNQSEKIKLSSIELSKDSISFKVEAEEGGWVIVNVNYIPGWQAFIDNKSVSVARANLNYLAVFVDTGSHQVKLRFSPWQMVKKSF